MLDSIKLSVLLSGIAPVLKVLARRDAAFKAHLDKQSCVVQIQLKDNSQGRIFEFVKGRIRARRGIHPAPDVAMIFKDAATAVAFMRIPADHAERIHAAKNFRVEVEGPDELVAWFMQLLNMILKIGRASCRE